MSRSEFPRVFELIDLIEDRDSPDSYFREFEIRVTQEADMACAWRARESEFQRLDNTAWDFLKTEAAPYLTVTNVNGRGWSQLISILNQARGYNYLAGLGCTSIKFVPRSIIGGVETPDLEAVLKNREVACEVKTIGISDDEVDARRYVQARETQTEVPTEFLNKLDLTLDKAHRQLLSQRSSEDALRIAFVVINFDDWPGEHKAAYYEQIDKHLAVGGERSYQIVFFNQKTIFHDSLSMKYAKVVNESR
jgi:hypothetical protein